MWLSTASGATEWVEKRAPGVMRIWILLHICSSSDPVEALAAWEEPIFMSMSEDKMFKHLDGLGRKSDSVDSATRKSFTHKKCPSLVRLLSSSRIPTVAEGSWQTQENYQIVFFSIMQVMSPANHSSMEAREACNNFKLKVGFPEGKTVGWPCMILLVLCPCPPPSLTG